MISIVRSKDGSIKSFAESTLDDYNLVQGETVEQSTMSFLEYSRQFFITCKGHSGESVYARHNSGDVEVEVHVDAPTVDVAINGSIETLTPIDGIARILLGTEVPGLFIIEPADRKKYCAAGEGRMVIEVVI